MFYYYYNKNCFCNNLISNLLKYSAVRLSVIYLDSYLMHNTVPKYIQIYRVPLKLDLCFNKFVFSFFQ